MKTKEDMLSQGYEQGWATECPYCLSNDCHAYEDLTVCFECNKKWKTKTKEDENG